MRKSAKHNFTFLLGGLLFLCVLVPGLRLLHGTISEINLLRSLTLVGYSLFSLISLWSLYREALIFRIGLWLTGFILLLTGIAHVIPHHAIILSVLILVIVFSALSCFIAGRHVFSLRDTDANSLTGAICVYLLLGVIWALLYEALALIWTDGLFQGLSLAGEDIHTDDFLYFSFVTLTTAGYGDITPTNPFVRTLTYLEMITGQFYMAILVSGLVAHFMGQRLSK